MPLTAKYTCPGCHICPHPSIFCVPLSSRNLSAFDAATFLLPLPEFAFTEFFLSTMSDVRPRRRVVPSAHVIDPLNAGDKEVSSHHTTYTLARQQEEDSSAAQQEASKTASAASPMVSSLQSVGPAPDAGQPGTTTGAPKRSLTQASIDSTDTVNLKRKSSLFNIIKY